MIFGVLEDDEIDQAFFIADAEMSVDQRLHVVVGVVAEAVIDRTIDVGHSSPLEPLEDVHGLRLGLKRAELCLVVGELILYLRIGFEEGEELVVALCARLCELDPLLVISNHHQVEIVGVVCQVDEVYMCL